jgi:hypothetical protein
MRICGSEGAISQLETVMKEGVSLCGANNNAPYSCWFGAGGAIVGHQVRHGPVVSTDTEFQLRGLPCRENMVAEPWGDT